MTDRDLLEAAARNSGFGNADGRFIWTESEYPRGTKINGALWNYFGYMETAELWNPLTDDGDALRLAVKLNIGIEQYAGIAPGFVRAGGNIGCIITEPYGDDPYAATRRAIVRAASCFAAKEPSHD